MSTQHSSEVGALRQDISLLLAISSMADVLMKLASELPKEGLERVSPSVTEMMARIQEASELLKAKAVAIDKERGDAAP